MVSTQHFHSLIKRIWVDNSTVTSDHFPVFTELSVDIRNEDAEGSVHGCKTQGTKRVDWSRLSQEQLDSYKESSRVGLSQIKLDHPMILCDDVSCADPSHTSNIDYLYRNIKDALVGAGNQCIENNRKPFKQVPDWHDVCAEHHDQAREAFHLWCMNGRPRGGPIYQLMKLKRAHFKMVFRKCNLATKRQESDRLAQLLLGKDQKEFWNEIKKMNTKNKPTCTAESIGGASGEQGICDMWKDHFKTLLNSVPRSSYDTSVLNDWQFQRFTPQEVVSSVCELKSGKSPGPDLLVAEHLRYADPTLNVLLSILINSCLIHGYLPSGLMETIIIPIVKNPKGVITSKDNYRPIAITSVLSKVVEKLILQRYSSLLHSSDHQFGFKSGSSTDLCIFTLKQIVDYYKCNGSPVYMCFLDASKAFDRVHHDLLFSKITERGIPHIIVRLLMYWYATQTFVIRWGSVTSESFTVSNGVRQGSILSPTFFNVYIDCLSLELSQLKIGCMLNSTCINHLVYADDTVLLAPSPTALQKLIDRCADFANRHGLIYNEIKTKYMCVKPSDCKHLRVPHVTLNDSPINTVHAEKYLGFMFSDNGLDNDHIVHEMRSTYARGGILLRNFKHCSLEVKIKLYQTYCSSIYCCGLFSVFHKRVIQKLRVAFNKIFKSLLCMSRRSSASNLFVSMNVDNFLVRRRKLTYSLFRRVSTSSNSLISCIFDSIYFNNCKLKNEWDSILYL